MSLGSAAFGAKVQSGHISDKTMTIALEYRDVLHHMQKESANEFIQEMCALLAVVNRLEEYVSLLDERKAEVIRQFYFERNSWSDLEKIMHRDKRSLQNWRNQALDELAEMYSYLEGIKSKVAVC
jgi:hypothetical protein